MTENLTTPEISIKWEAPEALVNIPALCLICSYWVIIFIISVIANLMVIWTSSEYNVKLQREYTLVLTLSILNLIGTLVIIPLNVVSAYHFK